MTARRRRISVSAARPACSTPRSAYLSSASVSGSLRLTAPTWSTITQIPKRIGMKTSWLAGWPGAL
jgi:hypothetical protein